MKSAGKEKRSKSTEHLYSTISRIPQPQRCFSVTYRVGVQPLGSTLEARAYGLRPATKQPCAALVRRRWSTPRKSCDYTDYYSFTDHGGMEGWVILVGSPIADTLPTKWSPVRESPSAKNWLP